MRQDFKGRGTKKERSEDRTRQAASLWREKGNTGWTSSVCVYIDIQKRSGWGAATGSGSACIDSSRHRAEQERIDALLTYEQS